MKLTAFLGIPPFPFSLFYFVFNVLFSDRNRQSHSIEIRLQCLFLSLIDGILTRPDNQVMILACTNRPHSLDAAFLRYFRSSPPLVFANFLILQRRMQRRIKIELPNVHERERILQLVSSCSSIYALIFFVYCDKETTPTVC